MSSRLSDEARLQQVAGSLADPVSRRVFLKLCAAAGASIALPSVLASCGSSASQSTTASASAKPGSVKTGVIGESVQTLANDYTVQLDAGTKLADAALGCGYQIMLHEGDTAKQLGQIASFAASGGRMMMGQSATEAVVPAVARAAQKNSIYYSNVWDTPAGFTPLDVGDYWVMYQTPHSEQIGYEMAKLLFDAIGGEGQVVFIAGILGATADTQRTAGLHRALKEFPGITLVGGQPGNWNRIDARKVFSDYATAYSKMKGVYAQNDSEAMGVLSVLKERGITGVKVIGMDGNKEALQRIISGELLGTHLTVAGYQGGWMAVNVFDAFNGWKPSIPERMMYTGSILTTAKNAQQALDKVYGTQGLQYDWPKMSRVLNPDTWDPQNEIQAINPAVHWAGTKLQVTLNSAYSGLTAADFDKVTQLYADQYKTGPFKSLV